MNIANFGKSAVLVGVAVAMCVTATPPASAAPIEASIALGFGDSFGDGTPKSGIPNLLGCQRQDYRTDVIVAERLGMTSRNVACAGATIKQIMEGYKGEPSQLDAITDDVKVLLVSAGGNDAVGPTTTAACMVPIECTESNPIIKKGLEGIKSLWNPVTNTGVLGELYGAIAERTSARVLVNGYPVRVEEQPGGRLESLGCQVISGNERKLANRLVGLLNTALQQAAEYYGFTYVDPFESGWFNDGEDICSRSPYKLVASAHGPVPFHSTGEGVRRTAEHNLAKLAA